MPLQIRRGPTADRLATTPLVGELVYDTTTQAVYIGDGSTAGGLPVTTFSIADSRTTTAKMFLGESLSDNSVHSGVTFALVGNRLQATVQQNLSNYIGLIAADQGFKGNLWADDSGVIVNSETHTIYGNFVPQGDILPDSNEVYDLGSPTRRFKDLYLSGSSLYLGNAVVTSTGTAIDLPVGTTIGGQPVGLNEGDTYNIVTSGNVIAADSTVLVNTTTGSFHGDLYGSVFASDSSILVDARDGVLRGSLIGNVTGNVTGDVTGNADSADVASRVSLTPSNSSASIHYIAFTLNSNGDEELRTDTSLTYQPSTNTLGLSVLNSSTINATSVNATSVTGTTVFASTIDTADSSAITVIPGVVFNSDVTVENELNIGGDILPDVSEQHSLGSYLKKFTKLYLTEGNNALWIGNAAISGSGTTINLPAGSTVGGSAITTAAGSNATTITVNTTGTSADHFIAFFDDQAGDNLIYTDDTFKYNPGTGVLTVGDATIGTVTGNLVGNVTGNTTGTHTGPVFGDLRGSVFADDSTVLVDGPAGVLRGTLVGSLTGNVTGNVTGNITSTGTSSFSGTVSVTGAFAAATGSFSTSTYSSVSSMFGTTQAHSTADARNVTFARARGSVTSPSIVQNGDDIADLVFAGYGTSAYVAGAQIMVTVEDATPSNTSMKSRMVFSTNNGTSLVDHVTLDSLGVLTVNTFSSGSIQILENNITGLNSNEDIVIDPSGTGTLDLVVPAQSTVGSAGVASALPATPSTYFKIKVNGVEYVVPAYAVS